MSKELNGVMQQGAEITASAARGRGWRGREREPVFIEHSAQARPIIQRVDDPVWGFFMPLASPPFSYLPFGHIIDQISMSLTDRRGRDR